MKRSTDRILTTHIGSIGRPAELLEMLFTRAEGEEIDPAQFDPVVARAIADVVRQQSEVGLDVLNDGEQSKISFASYLKDRLAGFEVVKEVVAQRPRAFGGERADFPEYYSRPSTLANDKFRRIARQGVCTGPISWKDFSQVQRDIDNLQNALKGVRHEDAFISSISPSTAVGSQSNVYYKTVDEYTQAIADAMRIEYKAIVDAGFTLQVDLPLGGARQDGRPLSQRADIVADVRKQLAADVEALNYALQGIPEEKVRVHICFGSDPGPHHRDPDLREIIDILLGCKAHGLTLVCTSGRHEHEYRIWDDLRLPDGKVLIVGAIDHTSNVVEHPEAVAERIQRFADRVGRENVIASADCGFDPSGGIEELRVDRQIMWAKFRSLVEGAEIASRRLWTRRAA